MEILERLFTKLNLYDHLSRFQCIGEKISFFCFLQGSFCLFLYKFSRNIFLSCSKIFVFTVQVFYYITCAQYWYLENNLFMVILVYIYNLDLHNLNFQEFLKFPQCTGWLIFLHLPKDDKTFQNTYSALSGHSSTIYDPSRRSGYNNIIGSIWIQ